MISLYKLKKLPYNFYSLEPYIDTHTLALHYEKHTKNYLNKLNELLFKNDYNFNCSIELLSYHINDFNEEDRENILFNLGGVLNHIIYFHSMNEYKILPEGLLGDKILNTFSSLDNFFKLFKESALNLKGSVIHI